MTAVSDDLNMDELIKKFAEFADKMQVHLNTMNQLMARRANNFGIEYVLTKRMTSKIDFNKFPEEKLCFVCEEFFDDIPMLKQHMKEHGTPFYIKMDHRCDNLKMIDVTVADKQDEEKFVCVISSIYNLRIGQIVLVVPPENSVRLLKRNWTRGRQTEFDIYYGSLSTAQHPHSILILNDDGFIMTQFNFSVEQSFYEEHIKEKYLRASARRRLDPFLMTAILKPLPDYYPSQTIRSLCKKKLTYGSLTSEEGQLKEKIRLQFEIGLTKDTYTNLWTTFLELEDATDIEEFSMHDKFQKKIKIMRDTRNSNQVYYVLNFPKVSEDMPKIVPGTDLLIYPSKIPIGPRIKINAKVFKVMKHDILLRIVSLNGTMPQRLNAETFYHFRFKCNRTSMQTIRQALDYVEQQKIAKYFFPQELVSSYTLQQSTVSSSSDWEWINESVKSNPEQQTAIKHIVEKTSMPFPYILMGPPGTGKTTTIVEAVCQIIKRDPQVHILIAANSNDAVNVIAQRLLVHLDKQSVLRIFASSKENEIDSIDPELLSISNLRFARHYNPHITELSKYNVILTTLIFSGKFAQAEIKSTFFSYVFIDEAGSSTEPTTLVPIAGIITSQGTIHGQIILAGDPKQLGPVVKCKDAEALLGKSLLERLIDTGIYARGPNGKYNPRVMTMLLQNYRSHPKILEFSNEAFYNGELEALGKPELTHWACDWKMLPNKSIPIFFENIIGLTQQDRNSTSWYNMREVNRVIIHIQALLDAKEIGGFKITEESIGVITPYKMQCDKIEDACKEKNWKIDVGSVEKFQGQEKPIMILTTVRSQTHTVGFLNNPKRLNVALTRAQALLIIVGNVQTLETDALWAQFIDFCRNNNLIKSAF